jgi:UDP-N-acetylglucosamine transferase subunit ALG13
VIFVTIGSSEKGLDFTRLVEAMDRIAGRLGVDCLIQRGAIDYEPKHARHVRFVRFDEALRLFRDADLVVGHCGAGTVLNAILFRKPLLLVPRRRDAGELDTDDHQMQLARELAETQGVRVVWDIERLEEAVREALQAREVQPQPSAHRGQFIEAIRKFLASPR